MTTLKKELEDFFRFNKLRLELKEGVPKERFVDACNQFWEIINRHNFRER